MWTQNFYKMQHEKKMHQQPKPSQQQRPQHPHENFNNTTMMRKTRTLQIINDGAGSFEDVYKIEDNVVHEVRGFFTGILFLLVARELIRRCFSSNSRE
mmetsp:Transcript_17043/g.23985  ORF Transcript_17043/g.23985 Transcript_17043/m.23985 type:complete len:98 (-) Transcript_17043:63-356(-)